MAQATELPPHAPETGLARRILGDFHVTGLFWYRFHRWAVATMPEASIGPIIAVFTTMFFCTIFRIRDAIARNLDVALGPCGFLERQRRIYRTMWNFAWCLTERYERLATDRSFATDLDGFEHWESVSAGDGGFVMVTAHLGMYEVGSMVPASVHARRVHLVREPEVDPRAQEFIRRSVAAVEGDLFTMHFQTDDPLQGVELLEALRRGEIVAMQGDRPRRGARTVDATLFGRPFALPSGPAALARAAGVPMLPVFAVREGRRRYRLVFGPPVEIARTGDRNRDVGDAMRRVGHEIEAAVRRAPHQWFVFRALW
jgi:lauroyl/myristoyl acyltransferase